MFNKMLPISHSLTTPYSAVVFMHSSKHFEPLMVSVQVANLAEQNGQRHHYNGAT